MFLSISFLSHSIFAQDNLPQKSSDANETILKYQEFLREETKLHREYTQEYYEMIYKLLGGIGLDLELIAIGDAISIPQGFYDAGRVTAGGGSVGFSDGGVMPVAGFEHFSKEPCDFL